MPSVILFSLCPTLTATPLTSDSQPSVFKSTSSLRTSEIMKELLIANFTVKFSWFLETGTLGLFICLFSHENSLLPLLQSLCDASRKTDPSYPTRQKKIQFSSPSFLFYAELWLKTAFTISDTYLVLNYPQPHIFP